MSCTRRGSKDRTPRRTHIFLSVVSVAHLQPSPAHARGSRLQISQDVCCPFAHPEKSSTHTMFHRPLLDVPDSFPSLCSTPPPSTPTALPVTWNHETSLRYSARRPHQACTTMFFLIPNNVTSERPIALMPTLILWWEAMRALEVAKWQQRCRIDWDAADGRNW